MQISFPCNIPLIVRLFLNIVMVIFDLRMLILTVIFPQKMWMVMLIFYPRTAMVILPKRMVIIIFRLRGNIHSRTVNGNISRFFISGRRAKKMLNWENWTMSKEGLHAEPKKMKKNGVKIIDRRINGFGKREWVMSYV